MMEESEQAVKERRKEPRYRLNKMLGLQLAAEEYSADLRIYVLDISGTGLRLTTPSEIPLEQDLRFVMRLPDKMPPISGQVTVRWQRFLPVSGSYEAGFEFLDLSEENWRALREFVGELLSNGGKKQENLCNPWHFGKFPY